MLNKYLIGGIVALALLAYLGYNQYVIRNLKQDLAQQKTINQSLEKKIEVEKNLNSFIRKIKEKQREAELELKELTDEDFNLRFDDFIDRFNSMQ